MKALFGWGRGVVTIAAVALTGCAGLAAAPSEDARRIVDRAEPLRCEIHALEQRLKATPAGSEEIAKITDEIGKARAALKLHYMATMLEYIEVRKTLPFEERKKVYAYSRDVAERCAGKQKLKSQETR
jgi:hypothetical protein